MSEITWKNWFGFELVLEFRAGDLRFPGKDGEVLMTDHYGYIQGTEGADGEEIDIYLNPEPSGESVYRVTQVDTRSEKIDALDEHKYMLGYKSITAASEAYLRNMPSNAPLAMFGGIDEIDIEELRAFAKESNSHVEDARKYAGNLMQKMLGKEKGS